MARTASVHSTLGGRVLIDLPRVSAGYHASVSAQLHAWRARVRSDEERIPVRVANPVSLHQQNGLVDAILVDVDANQLQQHNRVQGTDEKIL